MFSLRKLLGIRTEAEKEREKEMAYRMKVARARRQTNGIRRKSEDARRLAIEYEKNGNHEKAVSAALQAQKSSKVAAAADNQIQQCADIHEMAKTQKAMKEIMDTCKDLSEGIIELADMEGAMTSQADNEEAMTQLIDTREQMEMFIEGIKDGATREVRNTEGEAALAALLAEQAVQEPAPKVKLPEIKTVEERNGTEESDWLAERRETLKALSADV